MCSSPILIPNPYYGLGSKGLNFIHDTVNTHLSVPCGVCHQCCSVRQSHFNQRIQMESFRSEMFMITLTYCDDALLYTNIGEYNIAYPEYSDIQNMMKRIRKSLSHPVRYTFCSEYGSRRFRPHFHGIIAITRDDIAKYYKGSISYCENKLKHIFLSEWRRNISADTFNPDYIPLCHYIVRGKSTTYDFHHIQPILNHDNDVSFYVSKYVLKYDTRTYKLLQKINLDARLSDDERKYLTSMIKPRMVMSKDFGDARYPPIKEYITKCINKHPTQLPQFYDIHTGQSSLLSRYYRKHCDTMINALHRYYMSPSSCLLSNHRDLDNTALDYYHTAKTAFPDERKFSRIKRKLNLQNEE